MRRLLGAGRGLVTELDPEAVLIQVLQVARELTGARYAALGILNFDRTELERFITSGIGDQTRQAIGDLPRGRGLLGELIRHPEPLRLDHLDSHPMSYGFPPGHPPMTSFLGVPVLVRGEAYGNLYLTDREDGPFDATDEETLSVLAEWAGVAIANSRLHADLEQQRDDLERAVRGLEATTTIATAIGGETDLDRILELIVKRGRALVEARTVLILLAEGDELAVAACAGEVTDELVSLRLPISGSVPGAVLRSGRSARMADVQSRVPMAPVALAAGAQTELLVPLAYRGESSGVLVAFDRLRGGPEFDTEDERLLRSFAFSAATAVATAQTVKADRLRHSIDAAEQERRRWARDLHDETMQSLASLKMLLEAGARRPGGAEAVIAQASEQLGMEVEKLQALITELRPAALDDIGLASALVALVERSRVTQGFEATAEIDLDYDEGRAPDRLPMEVESTVYRLVQEALTNVGKHAGAMRVSVTVAERDGSVHVEVSDDGTGFESSEGTGGFGLVGMRERAALLEGDIDIVSAPGRGTSVKASVPSGRSAEPAARLG
ncbi:MAG: GAF domain-containing protein [Candidatus Limnocylindria bacterium]